MKHFLLLLLFLLPFIASAQDRLPATLNPADSSQFIYENSLHYEGSSVSVDPNYRYILDFLAEKMRKNPTWTLHIRGHVCCGPSEKISKKRAKGVYDYLLHLGVPANRMTHKGYSDLMPLIFPEKTEDDENGNRRVDFVIHR